MFNGLYNKGKLGHCGYEHKDEVKNKSVWRIKFKNRTVLVHRIIWELVNGKIPPHHVIDHIDGNSLNNKICNLRITTQEYNCKNKRISKNNTSGVTGIHVSQYSVRATWRDASQLKSKRFNIRVLGYEEAIRQAVEYRKEQLIGQGYTERHGT